MVHPVVSKGELLCSEPPASPPFFLSLIPPRWISLLSASTRGPLFIRVSRWLVSTIETGLEDLFIVGGILEHRYHECAVRCAHCTLWALAQDGSLNLLFFCSFPHSVRRRISLVRATVVPFTGRSKQISAAGDGVSEISLRSFLIPCS